MAHIVADFVEDTTITTGTGAKTLAGAINGRRAIGDVCANGDTIDLSIFRLSGAEILEWETGRYTYATSGDTITAAEIYASSNSNNAVSFGAGTKYVVGAANAAMPQGRSPTNHGTTVASASTINLDTAKGVDIDISGTTTITAVTLGAGKTKRARATGAFQMTASSSLIVNGSTSVNYTTTAEDLLFFEGYSSSVVRVWTISKAAREVSVVRVQTFTGSGTYTPHAKMLYCVIECVGGGGGGGSVANQTGTNHGAGGGGQAGTYSMKVASAATIGASQTVTIGAAGSGGTANTNNAGNGGQTSVGSICTAPGGNGAAYGVDGGGGVGGSTGTTGTGDVSVAGEPGATGQGCTFDGLQILSGRGGSGPFGKGGAARAEATQISGIAASGYGAGGGGGISNAASSGATGGAGTAGYVLITEYCSE